MGLTVPLRREACRTCGARGYHDATGKCRQSQGIDGDYHCPGDAPREEDIDSAGYFRYPTKRGQKIIDDWIDGFVDTELAKMRGERSNNA